MTTISLSTSIPTNIATLEQLHIWSGLALGYLNPTLAVLETANSPQKSVQTQIFQAADDYQYMLIRTLVRMEPTFVSDRSKKLWMFGLDLSNTALPAGFSAN